MAAHTVVDEQAVRVAVVNEAVAAPFVADSKTASAPQELVEQKSGQQKLQEPSQELQEPWEAQQPSQELQEPWEPWEAHMVASAVVRTSCAACANRLSCRWKVLSQTPCSMDSPVARTVAYYQTPDLVESPLVRTVAYWQRPELVESSVAGTVAYWWQSLWLPPDLAGTLAQGGHCMMQMQQTAKLAEKYGGYIAMVGSTWWAT
jgi:hypothetical protein